MAEKFICKLTKEELENIYSQEGMTLKKLCPIAGCKSEITMRKTLIQMGIDTNHNAKLGYQKRGNRTDEEFKLFLIKEYYNKKRSMVSIAKELNISWVIVSRYLDKYNIPKRTKSEQQTAEGSVNWKGGRNLASSGYYEIYLPDHPRANKRKSVYEHDFICEMKLGRYLRPNEVVHHIDFDKSNNSLDNLIVLTKSDHLRLHAALRKGVPFEEAVKGVNVINE